MVFKKKWRTVVPLTLVFLLAGYFGVREFWRWWGINGAYRDLVKEETELKEKSLYLKSELENLQDPEFLDKEARTRLNLKKEGESVLVVVSENNFPPENFLKAESVGLFEKEGTIWFNLKSWLDYFFKPR